KSCAKRHERNSAQGSTLEDSITRYWMTARCHSISSRAASISGSPNRKVRNRMNTHRFKTVGYGRVFLVVLLLALMGCSSITHSSSENGNQPANTNTTMQETTEKPNANQVDKRQISAN